MWHKRDLLEILQEIRISKNIWVLRFAFISYSKNPPNCHLTSAHHNQSIAFKSLAIELTRYKSVAQRAWCNSQTILYTSHSAATRAPEQLNLTKWVDCRGYCTNARQAHRCYIRIYRHYINESLQPTMLLDKLIDIIESDEWKDLAERQLLNGEKE